MILLDVLVVVSIVSVVIPKQEKTKECSIDLYWVGISLLIYNIFFVSRNILICGVAARTKNPLMNSTTARLGFIVIDCIAYTSILAWSTTIVA